MAGHGKRVWAALGVAGTIVAIAGFRFAQARAGGAPPVAVPTTGFVKGPYLQSLGSSGVTVKLELAQAGAARLEVYPAGENKVVAAVEGKGSQAFHAIRADGLSPATSYEYVVTAGGATSERGRFTTAPTDARPFRFLVYGDNRTGTEAHAAVVRAMASTPGDFLINTGDMVARGYEANDWQSFFAVEGPMLRDRCIFASVGNHEIYRGSKDGEVAFLRYFAGFEEGRELTRLYGSFRWSNTRFFVLNAMDNWTGAERDWLRDELDRSLREPGIVHRIAVMHWGPFSAGPHGGNPALASGDVIALMRDRKVDLVLAGHDHMYERGAGGGLKYIISGGGGAPLYEKKFNLPETAVFEPAYHFVEVSIDGEKVKTIGHRASGGVFDACGYTGTGPWDCAAAGSAEASATPVSPGAPASPGPAAPAGPTRAKMSACGCWMPGGGGDVGAVGGLVAAAMLALARRRKQ